MQIGNLFPREHNVILLYIGIIFFHCLTTITATPRILTLVFYWLKFLYFIPLQPKPVPIISNEQTHI